MADKKRGRDYKPGLDRTQFDTNFARKSASLSIRQRYGLEGLAVLYEVIVWINEDKGCYVAAPTLRKVAENFAMTRLFDVTKIDWVMDVFEFMLEIGFFDPEAFENDQILTSFGIVKRWYRAKRNPDSYPLPTSVRTYLETLVTTENAQQITENEQQIQENAQQITENCNICAKEKKRKEKKSTPLPPADAGDDGGEDEPVQDSLPEDGLTEPEREVVEAWNRTFPAGDPRHLPGPPYPLNGLFKPNLFRALQSGLTVQQISEAFAVLRDSDHAWQLHSAVKGENVRLLLTEKTRKKTRAAPKADTQRYTSQDQYRNYAVTPALAGGAR